LLALTEWTILKPLRPISSFSGKWVIALGRDVYRQSLFWNWKVSCCSCMRWYANWYYCRPCRLVLLWLLQIHEGCPLYYSIQCNI
jgi:hypothetical protein